MSKAIRSAIVVLIILLVASIGIAIFALYQKKNLENKNQNLQSQLADADNKQKEALTKLQKLQQDTSNLTQQLNDKDKEKDQLQSFFNELKRKADGLSSQMDAANRERNDWKSRVETIRKERDELMTKLQNRPEKIIYKEKESEPVPAAPTAGTPEGDDYWVKVLKDKATLEIGLEKSKADLDKDALQVADLKKQNSDLQMEIKNLTNDKEDIERRLTNDKQEIQTNLERRVKEGEDLANNLSMEVAHARTDQKSANDFVNKVKEDNAQLQSQVKQLTSTKIALEKTVARLTQAKENMSKKLAETQGVIQDRIDEIWQIKKTLDQKITQINQTKANNQEVELPPIVVNAPGGGQSNVLSPSHKIISINEKNNFVIIDWGESQGSTIGRIFKAYRDDKEIAALEVIQVRRDISAADIKGQKSPLQVGDQVR